MPSPATGRRGLVVPLEPLVNPLDAHIGRVDAPGKCPPAGKSVPKPQLVPHRRAGDEPSLEPPVSTLLVALTLLACQEPFGTDRHTLEGFRIAALAAPGGPPGSDTVPRPALIVDGRLWSDEPVELRWYWLDDPNDLRHPHRLEPVAVGPAPELVLPERPLLGLVAVAPDGSERAASLPLSDDPLPLEPLALTVGDLPLTIDAAEAEDLALEARARLEPSPAGHASVGGFLRLSTSPVARTRWMATAGTWFELDATTADWAAGALVLDDDEVVERDPLPPSLVSGLVLGLQDARTTWRAFDLAVGPVPEGLWVHGRFFPSDEPVPEGPVLATLTADDLAPSGLRLRDPVPVAPGEPAPDVPCGDPGPFHPDWLVEGRCTRAELDGQQVLLWP